MLYGLNPLADGEGPQWLKPAMAWKTIIAQLKTLSAGSTVGYGNTYRTRGSERIAVLPVGYADGLRRSPRTWREVLVRGQRAPVVGRVSMEKTAINVSHIAGAQAGDEVVLLGKQGDDEISAEEISAWIGSINYEVVTSIAPRVPRTFVTP
jgi:alanine racemase